MAIEESIQGLRVAEDQIYIPNPEASMKRSAKLLMVWKSLKKRELLWELEPKGQQDLSCVIEAYNVIRIAMKFDSRAKLESIRTQYPITMNT